MLTIEDILKIIRDKGLTAYEISKEVPLTEAGILKLLKGKSKPRESSIAILTEFLLNKYPTYLVRDEKLKIKGKGAFMVSLDENIFDDPGRMATLVTFLSRNHEILIKDEIYRLYVERIIMRYKNEKKASDINSMLEDGD